MSIKTQITDDAEAVFDSGLTVAAVHTYGVETENLLVFFNNPYEVAAQFDTEQEATLISIEVLTANADNIDHDSSFLIAGTTYYVDEIQPDNEGTITIIISEHETG